jgi:hypothetical protein
MPQSNTINDESNYQGGDVLKVAPGKARRLLVAVYTPNQPQPEYEIRCNPDDESVAHHFFTAGMRDKKVQLYCQFENFGLKTVEVTLRRIA